MIKTIIFDFGGVLAQDADSWSGIYQPVRQKVGLTVEEMGRIWDKHWSEIELGQEDLVDFLADLSPAVPAADLLEIYAGCIKINPEVLVIANQLVARGYPLVMLSNESREGADIRIGKVAGIFKSVYISALLGMKKPDQKLYNYVLEKENVLPEEVIFIDDREKNISVAKEMGMKTILFQNPSQLQKELDSLL